MERRPGFFPDCDSVDGLGDGPTLGARSMKPDTINQTLSLRDGRKLGFAEYGPQDGKPVIHFNGSGCSRLERPPQVEILDVLGIRFISTDRPGHGLSDPHDNRTLSDWTNDVAELADHLGFDKFYVEGWSGGGPYALACAHDLKDRVIAGASLSGLAPYERPNPYKGLSGQIRVWMFLCRCFPKGVTPFRKMIYNSLQKMQPGQLGEMMSKNGPEPDQKAMASPDAQQMMDANIREGYRQGWEGPVQDDLVLNSPWPFELESIQTRIDIWQGSEDVNVPVNQGQYLHSRLPNSTLHVLEGEAHIFPLSHWREILETLTQH